MNVKININSNFRKITRSTTFNEVWDNHQFAIDLAIMKAKQIKYKLTSYLYYREESACRPLFKIYVLNDITNNLQKVLFMVNEAIFIPVDYMNLSAYIKLMQFINSKCNSIDILNDINFINLINELFNVLDNLKTTIKDISNQEMSMAYWLIYESRVNEVKKIKTEYRKLKNDADNETKQSLLVPIYTKCKQLEKLAKQAKKDFIDFQWLCRQPEHLYNNRYFYIVEAPEKQKASLVYNEINNLLLDYVNYSLTI